MAEAAVEKPFTVTDVAFIRDPFATYQWLRDEHPVYRDPRTGFFVATRFDDVSKIARSPADWSNKTDQIFNRTSAIADEIASLYAKRGWLPMDTLVSNDPPDHRRYRQLVDKAFSLSRVKSIEPFIETVANTLSAKVTGAGPIEFVGDYAVSLTMTVIAGQLGVDAADMDKFRRWTEASVKLIDPVLDPDQERELTGQIIEMQHYLAAAIERYRIAPGSTILSDLVHANVEGGRLNVQELLSVAHQLLTAGNDTTTSALANAVRHLAEHPDIWEALQKERSKIPQFVEEVLRLYAPVQRLFRRARRDLDIAGVPIPKGSVVVIQWGGANLDERRFECPHQLDLERVDADRHLSFGTGIHFCIGNQLARSEMRIAIGSLLDHAGSVRLARGRDSFGYAHQPVMLAPERLEVVFTPR